MMVLVLCNAPAAGVGRKVSLAGSLARLKRGRVEKLRTFTSSRNEIGSRALVERRCSITSEKVFGGGPTTGGQVSLLLTGHTNDRGVPGDSLGVGGSIRSAIQFFQSGVVLFTPPAGAACII